MTVPQRRSGWPRVHLAMGFVVAVAVYLAADRYATTEVAAFLKDRRQALYAALVSVHITMLGFALATLTVVLGTRSPRASRCCGTVPGSPRCSGCSPRP